MSNEECYKILGLNPNCSKENIKTAYKSLAKKWHPDLNKDKNAEEEFKKVQKAYETLMNNNDNCTPFDPIDNIFGNIFTKNMQEIWINQFNMSSSGNISFLLEFDSLSKEEAIKILELLHKEGFKIKKGQIIKSNVRFE